MQRLRAAFGYLLLAPPFLAILFIPGFLFPYASSKSLAFRALGILVLAVLVWLVLLRAPLQFGRLKQRITWIPAALLVVAYLSSLLGVGFHHSFWSSFERGDGLLTLTVAVLYFYAILLHADPQFLRKIAVISTWVGGVVSLYALVQWAHVSVGMPIPMIMVPGVRIGATFGNAAFMASYLGMTLFLALWVARGWNGWLRVLAYSMAVMQLLAILVSGTRGTMVALLLAGITAAIHAAWRGQRQTRPVARALLAACVVLAGLFFVFRAQLAQVPLAPVQRLAGISLSSGTSAVRLVLWESIGREALRHPLAGVGAEHVDYVYNRAYSPELISGQWNDHSHNLYLDYFVQFGAPGLLLYLALVLVALQRAHALLKAGNAAGGYLFLLLLTCGAQNFFVFDVALTLWMFLAVLALVVVEGAQSLPRSLAIPRVHVGVASAISAGILLLLIPVAIQPVRANLLIAKAVSRYVADPEAEVRVIDKGLALRTYADFEYGYNLYNMYAFQQEHVLAGRARVIAHQKTQDVLAKNLERYPYDVRTAVYLAHIIDQTPPELMPDLVLLRKAVDAVLKVSPFRPGVWYYRANAEIRQGDAEADASKKNAHYLNGIDVLKQYAAMQPGVATPRFAIANLYLTMADPQEARVWAEAGDAIYGPRLDIDAARAAAAYYINIRDWVKATRYLNEVAGSNMADYPAIFDLARTRYLSGDRSGALELVNYLRQHSPDTLAADPEFIAALQQQ